MKKLPAMLLTLCPCVAAGCGALAEAAPEGGCKVDLPLEPVSNETVNALAGLLNIDSGIPSFTGYFDGEMLDGLMNDWY